MGKKQRRVNMLFRLSISGMVISMFLLLQVWWRDYAAMQYWQEIAERRAVFLEETDTDRSDSTREILPSLRPLYESNPDLVGWLTMDSAQIDFPVMQTPDDPEHYLRRNFDGENDNGGTPFADFRCHVDPVQGFHTVIYIHGGGFIPIIEDRGVTFNGHTYCIYGGLESGNAAKAYCESLGGHLATITSAAEDAFLFAHIQSLGLWCAFFGYSDSASEGVWQWVTGEDTGYENWESNEPNGIEAENWAMYYFEDGTWNDDEPMYYALYGEDYFICEWDDIHDVPQRGNSGIGGATLPNTSAADLRNTYAAAFLFCALCAAAFYEGRKTGREKSARS